MTRRFTRSGCRDCSMLEFLVDIWSVFERTKSILWTDVLISLKKKKHSKHWWYSDLPPPNEAVSSTWKVIALIFRKQKVPCESFERIEAKIEENLCLKRKWIAPGQHTAPREFNCYVKYRRIILQFVYTHDLFIRQTANAPFQELDKSYFYFSRQLGFQNVWR